MEEKVKAVVLKSVDFGEDDKLVSLYSVEKGKFSAVMRGVKKASAKLKFASEPFCFGEFLLANTKGRNVVINCSEIESFFDLRQDLDRFYCGCGVLETINLLEEDNQSNPTLFILLLKSMEKLNFGDTSPKVLLVKFLLEYLTVAGYELSFNECNVCHSSNFPKLYLDVSVGGVVCSSCRTSSSFPIMPTTLNSLRQISNFPLEKINVLKLNDGYVTSALKVVYEYISHSLNKIKSISQLLEL